MAKYTKRLQKVDAKLDALSAAVVRLTKRRPPPPPWLDSGTKLVLCVGLFLLLLAVLLVVIVHMVKTDGAVALLQANMRQWMQKFGGATSNAASTT